MNPALHGAVIAAKRRQEEEEEQKMTQYKAEDLDGWEFKIVRSAFGKFRNTEAMRRLMEEEAQNGWEMVEKFDNYRVRFKRRVEKRGLHSGGSVDPYRTNYGSSQIVLPLVGAVVALALGMTLFLVKSGRAGHSDQSTPVAVVAIIIAMVAAALVFLIARRK